MPEAHLEAALQSLLAQSRRPDEIVVAMEVEPPARLTRVIDSAAAFGMTIRSVVPEQQGLPSALNATIAAATGTYYARMDADDISTPRRFELQLDRLEQDHDLQILGTAAETFTEDPRENGRVISVPLEHDGIVRALHFKNPIIHPTVMFRKRVFAPLGHYSADYPSEQDLDLWIRAAGLGIKMANLPEVGLRYRFAGVIGRRSDRASVRRQNRLRFSHRTRSPLLNALKLARCGFHMLPPAAQQLGYRWLK